MLSRRQLDPWESRMDIHENARLTPHGRGSGFAKMIIQVGKRRRRPRQ